MSQILFSTRLEVPKYLFLLFFTTTIFSQTKTITGVISDDANKPLESANLISKPLTEIKKPTNTKPNKVLKINLTSILKLR